VFFEVFIRQFQDWILSVLIQSRYKLTYVVNLCVRRRRRLLSSSSSSTLQIRYGWRRRRRRLLASSSSSASINTKIKYKVQTCLWLHL
jgi:hypothetical protein